MAQAIQNDPLFWALSAVATGFIAGFGAYRAILSVGAHEVVKKGSYVLRSDIVGTLLRSEALQQLDHLVELGEKMSKPNAQEVATYITRAHTFVHYLDLPKDDRASGYPMSFAERQIDLIVRDAFKQGLSGPEKAHQIVGILKALRSSLASRTG